ncbi:2-succinyl-5-enolpyruvyl-6-hydroxy-3-cyclohexene-1-carboxylic-acid synthase [Polaribacter reichenbachii]|uniref:2-succinyl-5-enolpyruvyl-6-hydroxy-3-cyclohexene-1-carboxylate synthase n=1 Tax=Polaribacter reichenbachii TaxID=996801 RepID=A0A1B8TPV3_9FLAO|nr:2-succinyl-5-enolpyruvyl-6-hydroxy-3-cyclohexene-1-carboxylic-acid synthase [Polaribacter reichenbachii]APZ46782.1 2-succinyl-5-enolpyruvyl-6-hydroxy-3-cyclohexene-1-carboxylic-acid synthase [Polaribacter reichenbachii]AUC17425.1 2-succinyl-5-enolpyruvyl-6-hydroxy-3-cyclohexene-1-carboxylic-acid synthase [Polaribacter reichenbachii]OBY61700.1 2-succinyl-5-enolpyruvyl-6-hydroxy-3-cyclohexene-1-carboxylate synthase [Polaribacter reichenbachii]
MYPKKELAQLVISACHQFNIDTIVISPGSRNAPLTIGFSNHTEIETLSVVDERCAAFFALGIAQQKQKPVAILCTSGSALLNYYPAIAEAFYSNIPLVVISADRPKHLIDIGDGQTIRQENVFENHILFSANLIENPKFIARNSQLIGEALQIATSQKGPVHINVPFDEPLYETVSELKTFHFPNISMSSLDNSNINYQNLAEIWNTADKKMLVIGVNYPDEELHSLMDLYSDDESVMIFTETTSNLYYKKAVNAIDQLIFSLDDAQFQELQPDILITFGGMIVSKRIKKFLREYQPKHHWNIDEHKATNTFFCLTEFIQTKPVDFFSNFNKIITKKKSDYQSNWLEIRDYRREKHTEYLSQIQHSDFKVFEQVLESIPNNSDLQISNSAIIRYAQLFQLKNSLRVFCNRGTSGIDGSTSTAIGAAFASKNQTVFITGDLSFFYDSNALWNKNIPNNFRIVLINNSGGGIFKIIPGPSTTNAAKYFETPHCLTAEHLCKMYDFDYLQASSTETVTEALNGFYESDTEINSEEMKKPKILEIFTPSAENDLILKEYFKYIK